MQNNFSRIGCVSSPLSSYLMGKGRGEGGELRCWFASKFQGIVWMSVGCSHSKTDLPNTSSISVRPMVDERSH